MKNKSAKKQWTRTEWLLLLAPLVVVAGLALMSFAPQLSRAWQEWREYGSNRPLAVFYPLTQVKENERYPISLFPVTFSPDGKFIAAAEFQEASRGYRSRSVGVWNVATGKNVSSWQNEGCARYYVKQLEYSNDRTKIWVVATEWQGAKNADYGEWRDARTGKLISRQKIITSDSLTLPGCLHTIGPFFSDPKTLKFVKTNDSNDSKVIVSVQSRDLISAKNRKMNEILGMKFSSIWLRTALAKRSTGKTVSSFKSSFLLQCYYIYEDESYNYAQPSEYIIHISPDLKHLFIFTQRAKIGAEFKSEFRQDKSEQIEVFDTASGRALWKQAAKGVTLQAVTFSSSGLIAIHRVTQGEERCAVDLRRADTGELVSTYRPALSIHESRRLSPQGMRFSPDNSLLAVPGKDRLELWDVSDLN